jgi:hypothetical protein
MAIFPMTDFSIATDWKRPWSSVFGFEAAA